MVEDCKSALRFLKSPEVATRDRLDSSRVIVWGESVGDHAAAMLGSTSSWTPGGHFDVGDRLEVSSDAVGVVDYHGPTDFLQTDAHLPDRYQTYNGRDSPESIYLSIQITQISEKVEKADPCSYVRDTAEKSVSRKKPEFFIAHETADKILPAYMSRPLVQELEEFGIRYEYLPVEGADHVIQGYH